MDNTLLGALVAAACWLLCTELLHLCVLENPSEESAIVYARPCFVAGHGEQNRRPAYRQDTFPGSRQFKTVYGTIQIFEWGPEDGEKVLLVHGLGTPCIALGDMAREFVNRGYRVMLFGKFQGFKAARRG